MKTGALWKKICSQIRHVSVACRVAIELETISEELEEEEVVSTMTSTLTTE